MARIQRKKPRDAKKKKKQSDDPEAVSADGQAAAALTGGMKKAAPAARKVSVPAKSEPGKVGGWIRESIQFLREVKVELKKVTWPSRKQTVGSTVVVIILVMIISFFLGVADIGLSSLIQVVLQ